jgi:hypothetical protein
MAGRTISGTYSAQVTLTSAGDNPATIDTGSLLQAGLYGSAFAQWVVTNHGIVQGATGIALEAGGTVLNQDLIDGIAAGVYLVNPGIVTNIGTITADGTSGVSIGLRGGGTVFNQSQGTIGGVLYGVGSSNFVTVTNYGLIGPAADIGVATSSGLITNMAGATIQGTRNGVRIYDGGTVENAGTIAGGIAAVHIYAGATGLVKVDPGAVFLGTVDGGNAPGGGFVSTLEFAAGTAGVIGTLSDSNTQFINFEQIVIDPNANWDVSTGATLSAGVTLTVDGVLDAGSPGNTIANYGLVDIGNGGVLTIAGYLGGTGPVTIQANGEFAVTGSAAATEAVTFAGPNGLLRIADTGSFGAGINGFAPRDTIDLTGLTFVAGATASISGGILSITSGGVTDTLLAGGLADDTRFSTVAIPGETGTELGVLCFCAGTRIRTPSGEMSVEHLKTGDMVLTHTGTARSIAWIGTGRTLATRGRRTAATPVILRKGALADNVPYEDLHVTKGHAFYVDGVLIPVEFLVNHRSIFWDDRAREVLLYHVELDTHDVLIANGAPAESYRDDGNRWLFQNANTGWDQPPKPPCAPVLTGGPEVDAAWHRLLKRSGPRPGQPVTEDPGLHLLVDGKRLEAGRRHGGTYTFSLPARSADVRIVSRAGVPAELGFARDPRLLGVALHRIELCQGTRLRVVDISDPRLTAGFHAFESDISLRWTNGEAILPAELFEAFDGPLQVVLHLAGSTQYLLLHDMETAA